MSGRRDQFQTTRSSSEIPALNGDKCNCLGRYDEAGNPKHTSIIERRGDVDGRGDGRRRQRVEVGVRVEGEVAGLVDLDLRQDVRVLVDRRPVVSLRLFILPIKKPKGYLLGRHEPDEVLGLGVVDILVGGVPPAPCLE